MRNEENAKGMPNIGAKPNSIFIEEECKPNHKQRLKGTGDSWHIPVYEMEISLYVLLILAPFLRWLLC